VNGVLKFLTTVNAKKQEGTIPMMFFTTKNPIRCFGEEIMDPSLSLFFNLCAPMTI
jgi:hypothetical protein